MNKITDSLVVIPSEGEINVDKWEKLFKDTPEICRRGGLQNSNPPVGYQHTFSSKVSNITMKITLLNPQKGIKISGSQKEKEKDKVQLKDIVKRLKSYYDNGALAYADRNVICGHFSAKIGVIRSLIYEDSAWQEENALIPFFDAIRGVGKTVFASYTLGGVPDRATKLIENIKESRMETNEENFRRLFDYFWVKTRLHQVINLIKLLFIFWQSEGECGEAEEIISSMKSLREGIGDSIDISGMPLWTIIESTSHDMIKEILGLDAVDRQKTFQSLNKVIQNSI